MPFRNQHGRHAQQKRRRLNNRDVPRQTEDYQLITGDFSRQPYAYCCRYRGYLTKNMADLHKCNCRKCQHYKPLEWAVKRNKGFRCDLSCMPETQAEVV